MRKILLVILMGVVVAGCSSQPTSTDEDHNILKVYTTIYPLAYFSEKIGGEFVEVESIYPPGVDAHTYEPTPRTMIDLAKSDLFIYSGTGLEAFADDVAESLKDEDVTIVPAAEALLEDLAEHEDSEGDQEHEADHGHDHGDVDPHVWIDPILSIELAESIKDSLIEKKPDQQETFEENFKALKAELEELDQEFQSILDNANRHKILVSHSAYGYWEERYGIEQISVTGLSPTQEPSQKQLQDIIETAKKEDIQYIIFEQNVSTRLLETIQTEIGAEPLMLHNVSVLTDEDYKNNEDYFTLMKKNIETLKTALND